MKWLEKLRAKPLSYRKRFVWVGAIVAVIIVTLISIVFAKEWKWPEVDVEASEDLREIVQAGKDIKEGTKESIDEYNTAKDEAAEEIEQNLVEELAASSTEKNSVGVTMLGWEKDQGVGIVSLAIINNSENDVQLRSFRVYQGMTEVGSPREVVLGSGLQKEIDIAFNLESDEPVTGFEIGSASWLNLEASAAESLENTDWNYIFRIEDESVEPAVPEPEAGTVEESE